MKKVVALLALSGSMTFVYADMTTTMQPADQIPQNGQSVYSNPDLVLVNDVQNAIQSRFPNRFPGVKITANNGYVTLQGNVQSQDDKNNLEQLVSGMPGVQGINNQLTVQSTTGSSYAQNGGAAQNTNGQATGTQTTDPASQSMVERVRETLRTVFFNRYSNVQVSFENGQVTLRGVVPTQADKTAIETTVNKIVGEKGVNSQLIVQQKP